MNNPLKDTPAAVTEKLLAWGGKNLNGDPQWRIILAENHLVQRAGTWTEFEPDTEQVSFNRYHSDDGDVMTHESRQIAPDNIIAGTLWVPLYPCTGWILERWFPPSSLGSKEQWESALSQDGVTPMMGPFPSDGHYWMPSGGGPWEEIPDLEQIRLAIMAWENSPSHLHGEMDADKLMAAMHQSQRDAEEREERINDMFLKETEYAVEHNLSFIKNNPALSAHRNSLVNREGLASHI